MVYCVYSIVYVKIKPRIIIIIVPTNFEYVCFFLLIKSRLMTLFLYSLMALSQPDSNYCVYL